MKKLRSKGLSRRYWVTACTGCRMRRGQDLSIIILGGQEESKDTAYLSGCDSNVVGSALLSSLSALPDSLAPRVNSAVVTECLRIRFVFQRHVSSSVARPARPAPVCDRLPMFGADRRPAEAARPGAPLCRRLCGPSLGVSALGLRPGGFSADTSRCCSFSFLEDDAPRVLTCVGSSEPVVFFST